MTSDHEYYDTTGYCRAAGITRQTLRRHLIEAAKPDADPILKRLLRGRSRVKGIGVRFSAVHSAAHIAMCKARSLKRRKPAQ